MERSIPIKSSEEIETLRQAGKTLALIIAELKRSLKMGMAGRHIDQMVGDLCAREKVVPAFKGYRGYPANCCLSFNEQVVHGIPDGRKIEDGDIVSVDVGIIHRDYFSDTAFTAGFGTLPQIRLKLIEVTEKSLFKGIEQARPGNHLQDISVAIQDFVESQNFSIVRDFVGHGIGRKLHEDPEVPNYGTARTGPLLKEGMVLAIEPMVNMGSWETKILKDGWTVVTKDGQPSAHFEHTVAITKNGPEILTIG